MRGKDRHNRWPIAAFLGIIILLSYWTHPVQHFVVAHQFLIIGMLLVGVYAALVVIQLRKGM